MGEPLLLSGERTRPRVQISAPRRNGSLVQPGMSLARRQRQHAGARALPRLESQRSRPTRGFEVEDFVKQNQRSTTPLGAQGRALCSGATLGRIFSVAAAVPAASFDCRRHACLYRPNEGDGASRERRGYSIKLACDNFRLTQPRSLRFVVLALMVPTLGRGFPSSKSTAQFLPSFPTLRRARSRHLAAA